MDSAQRVPAILSFVHAAERGDIGDRGMLATTTAFTYLPFEVWAGQTQVTGSDHLTIGSFLGYERAELTLGELAREVPARPPGPVERKWSLTLSDGGQLRTVDFHCEAYSPPSRP